MQRVYRLSISAFDALHVGIAPFFDSIPLTLQIYVLIESQFHAKEATWQTDSLDKPELRVYQSLAAIDIRYK